MKLSSSNLTFSTGSHEGLRRGGESVTWADDWPLSHATFSSRWLFVRSVTFHIF